MRISFLLVLLVTAGCASSKAGGGSGGDPPGGDTSEPYPIDRGDDGSQTPGSYKGLPMSLTDNGEPAVAGVDGVIGVVCIGMSNSNQECGDFIAKVAGPFAGEVHPDVRIVNCAVGGHAIERWIDPGDDATLWDACIDQKLAQAGVTAAQVRVLYHKAANMYTTDGGEVLPPYPDPDADYFNFLDNLDAFAARVPEKFPSVQAVYTSSRSYGGFAGQEHRGEPLSYEEGHALNTWLRDNPEVGGVHYVWGPYIWGPDCASGVTNGSEVCYVRDDYKTDGIHPAQGGLDKISGMIHDRFREHAWYRP